ncbi:hypothetical protein BDY19DRAFT_944128 [Irpex rosettiformis]|uniref:Uncharacterized protein n=1 Tax=Irpex rosettiformis TaxID=378272 RepID=A0ACB8U541_9APHY|nr:hypothetical protein BDY19DRAFT_944128 [Irpex rosettiformis]
MVVPLGVAAPATYADATNLANQFLDLKEEILALPLTPKKLGSPAVHTSQRPNWAVAPDEPSTPSPREGRGARGRRDRGGGRVRGGPDTADNRPLPRKLSPMTRDGKNLRTGVNQRRSRSRTPSRSPQKAPTTPRERTLSAEEIIAPSPTYICLPPGSSVVVGNSQFPPAAGRAPDPAEVDALIRQLQNARGLNEDTGPVSEARSSASSPEKKITPLVENTPTEAPIVRPVTTERLGRPMWLPGQDGVLRPDFTPNNSAPVTPEKQTYVVSLPSSQVQSRDSSPRCTPSPLRQNMLPTVNELLERARERSRSRTRLSTEEQTVKGASSRVASPLREVITAPASPEIEASPAPALGPTVAAAPVVATNASPIVRLPTGPTTPADAPKAFKPRRPATTAGPDVFHARPKEHWPTLDEVLAMQAKSTSTSCM